MRKTILLLLLLISVPFHAERHVVVATYDSKCVSSALVVTDYLLIRNDSILLTCTDGNVILKSALCDLRSISVQDMEPTSVQTVSLTDTAGIQSGKAVKLLEDGLLYIVRDNVKYSTNGVLVP